MILDAHTQVMNPLLSIIVQQLIEVKNQSPHTGDKPNVVRITYHHGSNHIFNIQQTQTRHCQTRE